MSRFAKIVSIAACACAFAAVATSADALARKRHHTRSDLIVVHPRAFTDSGVVVPVGSRAAYVMQSTYFNMQPYERYSPGLLWRPDPGMR